MTHRAEQIIDAVVAALQSSTTLGVPSVSVYANRSLSLAEDQGEVPAICVDAADDSPAPEFDQFQKVASTLDLETTVYWTASNEDELKRLLFSVRREIHKAIVANSTLGLSFVLMIGYGGATKPVIDSTGEQIAGAYTSRWSVTYWMDPTDPG